MDLLRRLHKAKAKEEGAEPADDEILVGDDDSDVDNYLQAAEKRKVPMEDKEVQTDGA